MTRPPAAAPEATWFAERFGALVANVERFVRGKTEVVRLALVCMTAEGHILVDDVPGVGKTSIAKAIANSIDGTMRRIQFTPDLLPTDVTGVQVWNAETRDFEFSPGAIFGNVVLADEVNRASPKTQAALLEVMEERQVTVDSASGAAQRRSRGRRPGGRAGADRPGGVRAGRTRAGPAGGAMATARGVGAAGPDRPTATRVQPADAGGEDRAGRL